MKWLVADKVYDLQKHVGAVIDLGECFHENRIQVVVGIHQAGILIVPLAHPDQKPGHQGGANPHPAWAEAEEYLKENSQFSANYLKIKEKFKF